MLVLDTFYVSYKFSKHTLPLPQNTQRAMLLTIVVLLIQVGIFIRGLLCKHFFIGIGVLLVLPYLVVTIANLILLPIVYHLKKKVMNNARKKITKNENTVRIGITGSFGKSSIKTYLAQLLKTRNNVLSTPENINTEMGVSQEILSSLKSEHQYFIAEMGAYKKGEIKILGDIVSHQHAFLTWIGNQHLGLFWSQKNITKTKREIRESVKNHKWNLYVNLDGTPDIIPWEIFKLHDLETLKLQKSWPQIITYSISNSEAQAYAHIDKFEKGLLYFTFTYKSQAYYLQTNLRGKHNILNLTWVLAFCIDQGLKIEDMKEALLKLDVPKDTLEAHKLNAWLTLINDSHNLSVNGLLAWIEFLHYFDWKKILVLDDIIELGGQARQIHYDVGQELAKQKHIDQIFLVGKDYKEQIKKGLKSTNFDMKKVYYKSELAILKTQKQGTILLEWMHAGKFFKQMREG